MRRGKRVRAMLACMALVAGFSGAAPAAAQEGGGAAVHELARWVVDVADHRGAPFAIVDKRAATLSVFSGQGVLLGSTPALLGATPGDWSMPGVARRVLTGMSAADRTTPAGRFVSEPGRNLHGERLVWVDYASAFAIHRLRPAPARERRPERLASFTPDDNRITLGCVVVPEAFYDAVVAPVLGRQYGVVYVLPESGSLQAILGAN